MAAAFSAMGLSLALPLGDEEDEAPSLGALRGYVASSIGRDSVRALFIGEVPTGLVARVEQMIATLEPPSARAQVARGETRPIGFREAAPAWALVATLGSLSRATLVRGQLEAGPFALDDARVELAPSRLGAFLVVSGRGTPTPDRVRAWVLEIRRLDAWNGARSSQRALDLRERAREAALRFAATPLEPGAEPSFVLGVTGRAKAELDEAALEEALRARAEPAEIESDGQRSPETSVVARFPALFSGEPASDAGRGALLLQVLAEGCARLGLDVVASGDRGDGILAFTFTDSPQLGAIQAVARCLLRDTPSALAWEAARTKLLDELARDPLHPALEAIAAALYASAPSSAIPVQTRALRHRSGASRMAASLAARRVREAIRFSVSGPEHEAIATQLGLITAGLPKAARPPRPLSNGRPAIGPSVVEIDLPSVFFAGVRLGSPSPWIAGAFAMSWAKRAKERGLPVVRVLSGGHDAEGFAILAVPRGGSDPETLRSLLEAASPTEADFRGALRDLEREHAYRPRAAGAPPLDHAGERARLPVVTGRAYAMGISRDDH
jgi:hypothetical protein